MPALASPFITPLPRGPRAADPWSPVEISALSTAQATVFLQPNVAHAAPMVHRAFMALVTGHPAFADLADRIEEGVLNGDSLSVILAAAELERDTAMLALQEAVTRTLAMAPIVNFEPTVTPNQLQSGLHLEVTQTGERRADISLENLRVRRVDAYLEPATESGDRLTNRARGPRWIGSTFIAPTPWIAVAGLVDAATDPNNDLGPEDAQFFSPGKTTFENVNFDPENGGYRRWRLMAYGGGFGYGPRPPGLADDTGLFLSRVTSPWIRTIVLDGMLNVLALATSLPSREFVPTGKLLISIMTTSFVRQSWWDSCIRYWTQGESGVACAGQLAGGVVGVMIDILKRLPEILATAGRNAASAVVKDALEKVTIILDIWGIIASGADTLGFLDTMVRSNASDMWEITDTEVSLEPERGNLPEAFRGCDYEAFIDVVGGTAPFDLELDSDAPSFLSVAPVGGEGRRFKLSASPWPTTSAQDFYVFYARAYSQIDRQNDPNASFVEAAPFTISVSNPSVGIDAVRFPAGRLKKPGEALPIEVDASHCADASLISGGQVAGAPLQGPAALAGAAGGPGGGSVTLTGNATIATIYQDRPPGSGKEDVMITVNTTVGGSATRTETIDVDNADPKSTTSMSVAREPGQSFDVTTVVQDDNFDDQRVEIFARDVKLSEHPDGLNTKGFTLTELEFKRTGLDAATGEATYEGKKTVTLELPHPDNDGATADAQDDAPFTVNIEASDDNGKPVGAEGTLKIVVTNLAPEVTSIKARPAILPDIGSVPVRPLEVLVDVHDDNGAGDIGDVILDASAVGGSATEMMTLVSSNDDGDATYRYFIQNVPVSCKSGCVLLAQAFDADDADDNGRASNQASTTVTEVNLPPYIGIEGLLYPSPEPGKNLCPGDPMTFGVSGKDDNHNSLAATLILDGSRYAMVPTSTLTGGMIWIVQVPAPGPGNHSYVYEIRETNVFNGGLVTTSDPESFDVDDCGGAAPVCEVSLGSDEVCDGNDNDCDGEIDNGLEGCAGLQLHSPGYTVGRTPICIGDPVTYQVSVAGGAHPYSVEVDLTGPSSSTVPLSSVQNPNGSHSGNYGAMSPAPSPAGSYAVSFSAGETDLALTYPLLVQNCCDAPTETARAIGAGATEAGVKGGFAGWLGAGELGGTSALFYAVGDCTQLEAPISGTAFEFSAGNGWVAWAGLAPGGGDTAVVVELATGEETVLGDPGSMRFSVDVDYPWAVYIQDTAGVGQVRLHDLRDGADMPLSTTPTDPYPKGVVVDDGLVAWIAGTDIAVYDTANPGVTLHATSGDISLLRRPDITAGKVAWSERSGSGAPYTVVVKNLSNNAMTLIPAGTIYEPAVRISGDDVVWVAAMDVDPFDALIMHQDLTAAVSPTELSTGTPGVNEAVDVDEGVVVWINGGAVWMRSTP